MSVAALHLSAGNRLLSSHCNSLLDLFDIKQIRKDYRLGRTRLEKERDACEMVGDWKKAQLIKDIEHCFCSAHSRKRIGKGLMVYHTFLSII